jgi:hypothetical protein
VKVALAGDAYAAGHRTVARDLLETFLHEVQARQGDGLSRQAAATLRAVTRDGAAYLGLALDGARIPRLPSRG